MVSYAFYYGKKIFAFFFNNLTEVSKKLLWSIFACRLSLLLKEVSHCNYGAKVIPVVIDIPN